MKEAKIAEAVPTVGETPPGLSGILGGCKRLRGPVEMANDGAAEPFACVSIETLGRFDSGASRISSRLRLYMTDPAACSDELGTSSSSKAVAGWDLGDVK